MSSRYTGTPVAAAVPQTPEPSAIGRPSIDWRNDAGNEGAAPCTSSRRSSSTSRIVQRTDGRFDSTIRQISASVSARGVLVAIISRIDA